MITKNTLGNVDTLRTLEQLDPSKDEIFVRYADDPSEEVYPLSITILQTTLKERKQEVVEASAGLIGVELVHAYQRHTKLLKMLRDPSNWTKDGRWSPLMASHDKNIFNFIDQTLEAKISEDQPRLPIEGDAARESVRADR